MITPTVGRIVWFYTRNSQEEHAAIVVKVWSDTMVNLCVFGKNGNTRSETSVQLVQPGNEIPDGMYCTWMPYQIKKDTGSESGEKAAGQQTI